MHRLSLILLVLSGLIFPPSFESPHGDDFKIDCAKCHNPKSWSVDYRTIQFDHSQTNFGLEGAHAQTNCKLCHPTLIFNEAPSQCASCHNDVHSMSVGDDCARCHTSQTWLVDRIPELHEENGFPLIGAHNNLSCVDCHISETNLRFDRIGNECISCHRDDYLNTQNPNHLSSGFSINCADCHDPLGFDWDSNINHSFFPLTLGHDIKDCKQCHTSDNFSAASPECLSCHLNDYNSTTSPNHSSAQFSTDCASCHTTDPGWTPATFDHSFFALTLGHNIQDCKQCHTSDNYSDVSSECLSCHLSDYNSTTDPNHSSAQFPTDCASCHTTNPGWTPATFDHDGQFFPIYSGKHKDEWNSCTDCHVNSNNYAEFTCITCHTNPQTDNDHSEIANYVYESNACLQCHPDGSN